MVFPSLRMNPEIISHNSLVLLDVRLDISEILYPVSLLHYAKPVILFDFSNIRVSTVQRPLFHPKKLSLLTVSYPVHLLL